MVWICTGKMVAIFQGCWSCQTKAKKDNPLKEVRDYSEEAADEWCENRGGEK